MSDVCGKGVCLNTVIFRLRRATARRERFIRFSIAARSPRKNRLDNGIGNGFHSPITRMSGNSFMCKLPFCSRRVSTILAERSSVDENTVHLLTDLSESLVLGRIRPETSTHDNQWVPSCKHAVHDSAYAVLKLRFGRIGAQRGHVFADRQNHQVGVKREQFVHLLVDVVRGVVPFEICDVANLDLWPQPRVPGEGTRHKMNVILVFRAGRHAPVSRPADILIGSV